MSVSYSVSTGLTGQMAPGVEGGHRAVRQDVDEYEDEEDEEEVEAEEEVSQAPAATATSMPSSASPVSRSERGRTASAVKPPPRLARHWFLADGYAWDWAAAAVLLAASALPQRLVQPVTRHIPPGDVALSYPYAGGSTVPAAALYASAILGPLLLFSVAQIRLRSWKDWHHGLLSLAEALALAFNFKRWLNLIGRYRPDFYAREAAGIDSGDMAYPSGHAAYSFCAATVMMLYIWGKLQVFSAANQGRYTKAPFPKALIGLVPVAGAGFIAASRLVDYRHDFSDVNMGIFIGVSCGSIGYFLNFPSLFDSASWQARRRGHAGSHREAVQDSSWATTCSSDETDLLGSARPHAHAARGAGSHDTMPLPPATRTRA